MYEVTLGSYGTKIWSLSASLSDALCTQKPMTSKWALYKPNKVLYEFTDQNLCL